MSTERVQVRSTAFESVVWLFGRVRIGNSARLPPRAPTAAQAQRRPREATDVVRRPDSARAFASLDYGSRQQSDNITSTTDDTTVYRSYVRLRFIKAQILFVPHWSIANDGRRLLSLLSSKNLLLRGHFGTCRCMCPKRVCKIL